MPKKGNKTFGITLLPLGILLSVFLPLPQSFLDCGLCINFALSLLTMCWVFSRHSSSSAKLFPPLLLYLCLFRLGLNLASTRWIVASGTASPMIFALGRFFSCDNLGAAILACLLFFLINFFLVSKGAERIAEVRSRFILEALPGKQMALDTDLASGRASYKETEDKKCKLIEESDFFSAMEGVFRFIKGDTIVSWILLAVNAVAATLLSYTSGYVIRDLWITVLGDALVSQIPALFTASAAATLISKVGKEQTLLDHVIEYYMQVREYFRFVALLIFSLVYIPGSPKLPILVLGSILWIAYKKEELVLSDSPLESALSQVESYCPPYQATEFSQVYVVACKQIFQELGITFPKLTQVHSEDQNLSIRIFDQTFNLSEITLEVFLPLLRNTAYETLDGRCVQQCLEDAERFFGIPIEEVVPKKISFSSLIVVTRLLVKERISLRLFPKILEAIALYYVPTENLELLVEKIRKYLGKRIGRSLWVQEKPLEVITVDSHVEELISNLYLSSKPVVREKVIDQVDYLLKQSVSGDFRAIVTGCETRIEMKKMLEPHFPDLLILSHNELPKEMPIALLGVVSDEVLLP
ncbi:FHIPEP family type III secretion protein [Candidatus Chlamydia sanziniae]|uniref:Flagellar biosynthesis protein FlhA n=1 Tax=Candidatus Chlamydia sanziniae TaxID=1806891 RepID=A0A1A9HYD5_9CHLA|nr:FHIPEP family type III secretion protein [Candidatus Chlamydia sanziniae]ANH79103.1 Flagellar biosynthesis protein FlhA [Candidatus Chlamydia sanziniae]